MKKICTKVFVGIVVLSSVLMADFSSPGIVNYDTLELWQMESIVRNSASSRLEGSTVDNTLWFMLMDGSGNSSTIGELVSGPSADFGNAVSFAANAPLDDTQVPNVYAGTRTSDSWKDYEYVKVEMWVKFNETGRLEFISMTDSWRLYMGGNKLTFICYFSDGTNSLLQVDMGSYDYTSQWHYITAGLDVDGSQQLTITSFDESFDQSTSAVNAGKTLTSTNGYIYLAADRTLRRSFNGAIDNVRISRPDAEEPDFLSPLVDNGATQALFHLDEIAEGITPDDNSAQMRTAKDMSVIGTPEIVEDGDYPNDNPDFAGCVSLDGMTDYFSGTTSYGMDTSNFKVESWVKLNPGWTDITNKLCWIANYDTVFRLYLQNASTGPIMVFVVWDSAGTAVILSTPCGALTDWTHLAGEFNNGVISLYINGIKTATINAAQTSAQAPSTNPLRIGCNSPSALSRVFWGEMDDFRFGKAVAECGDMGYIDADINRDCIVDIEDLSLMVTDWLKCTLESDPSCIVLN
ncbi:MAG: LamG-like jellyroll fold domain-containing protein [Sedimentisphaeraceae bacterium JB056]